MLYYQRMVEIYEFDCYLDLQSLMYYLSKIYINKYISTSKKYKKYKKQIRKNNKNNKNNKIYKNLK